MYKCIVFILLYRHNTTLIKLKLFKNNYSTQIAEVLLDLQTLKPTTNREYTQCQNERNEKCKGQAMRSRWRIKGGGPETS